MFFMNRFSSLDHFSINIYPDMYPDKPKLSKFGIKMKIMIKDKPCREYAQENWLSKILSV